MPRHNKGNVQQSSPPAGRSSSMSSSSISSSSSSMSSSSSNSSGVRKVLYDDYTHTFYVESRLEALHRQVESRAQQTHVLNRSHDTHLRLQLRQANAEHIIFRKKNVLESTFHKDQLKDHLAHRHVLNAIARAKVNTATGRRAESHLGFYGLGASKMKIQPQIEQTIKENTPSALRRQKSFRILRDRRGVPIFDRTKTTSALLRMKSEIQSRPVSNFKTSQQGGAKQRVLPPITVGWANTSSWPGVHEPAETMREDSSSVGRDWFNGDQQVHDGGEGTATAAVVDDSVPSQAEAVFVTETQS